MNKVYLSIAAFALMVSGAQVYPVNCRPGKRPMVRRGLPVARQNELSAMLSGTPNYERVDLNLEGWNLGDIPELALIPQKFPNLRVLNLSGNNLTYLSPAICKLQDLAVLVLHNNRLTTLPKEIGNLKRLSSLTLWGNPLRSLPASMVNCTVLYHLAIDKKHLRYVPALLQGVATPMVSR